jgi:hypothetical protein
MFDPSERKEELERKKKEAKEKNKLGAIGAPIDDGPQVISLEQVVLDRDEQWLNSFRLFANVRAAYGVYSEGGRWVIKDEKLFDKVDKVKREKLRPFWGKPL